MSNYSDIMQDISDAETNRIKLEQFRKNLKVGDRVRYEGADSKYSGTIVCIFTKLNGTSQRCCVENTDGLLLIKSLSNALPEIQE
jgi:putative ribosome biogenesis GTPase RsgA